MSFVKKEELERQDYSAEDYSGCREYLQCSGLGDLVNNYPLNPEAVKYYVDHIKSSRDGIEEDE